MHLTFISNLKSRFMRIKRGAKKFYSLIVSDLLYVLEHNYTSKSDKRKNIIFNLPDFKKANVPVVMC